MSLLRDRVDAGQRLAGRLTAYANSGSLVLGLARGGVVVAAEIARRLRAELDVLVVRKVGAPWHPEFGIGAVAPAGVRYFDPATVQKLGLSPADLDRLAQPEEAELQRRLETYCVGRPPLQLAGRHVIIADDGLATGVTAVAAVRYARKLNPRSLTLAVPVCSNAASEALSQLVDVVCLESPEPFSAVGYWYEDFSQTSDAEVLALLTEARSKGYAV